ncbi:MAG: class I SAM-dependent methyltransferase [Elusimicrobia bacterium]|nr:class I SAM-dependent methyltransferase [Elusimicrobiota bacterium]
MSPSLPGDVVVLPAPGRRWLLYNVFTRTSLAVDGAGLAVLADLAAGGEPAARTCPTWETGVFGNADGLLADPTRIIRDARQWPPAVEATAERLAGRCRELFLLVDDPGAYRARFGPKKNLLDATKTGNFHQQLGVELLLKRRVNPEQWWVRQKFEDGLSGIRDNLYRAVQHSFLTGYFPKRLTPASSVVDVGCGVGYYTELIAASAGSTLGVDPNAEYIAAARRRGGKARYEVLPVGRPGGLDPIPSASADFVFMSDALLFYFVPPVPGPVPDIDLLFREVRRILKPGGVFISVEPHYIFWLAPWLGDQDRPFTVLTEYRRKDFGVTAFMSRLVQAFCRNGFQVSWMEELWPDPAFREVDPRAFHFADNFPVWQLFELRSA